MRRGNRKNGYHKFGSFNNFWYGSLTPQKWLVGEHPRIYLIKTRAQGQLIGDDRIVAVKIAWYY